MDRPPTFIRVLCVVPRVKSRILFLVNRAKYAAIGAAVGAAIGGLFSRNAASTVGAVGGLAGAVLAETRASAGSAISDVKERVRQE